MATKRPSIMPRRLPYRRKDLFLLALNALFFLVFTIYLAAVYQHLPAELPMHYGVDGTVDRLGSQKELWLLYGVYALTLWSMLALGHFPRAFNLPSWADQATAVPLAEASRTVLELTGLYLSVLFGWIALMICRSTLQIGPFLAFVVVGAALPLGWCFIAYRKIRRMEAPSEEGR